MVFAGSSSAKAHSLKVQKTLHINVYSFSMGYNSLRPFSPSNIVSFVYITESRNRCANICLYLQKQPFGIPLRYGGLIIRFKYGRRDFSRNSMLVRCSVFFRGLTVKPRLGSNHGDDVRASDQFLWPFEDFNINKVTI